VIDGGVEWLRGGEGKENRREEGGEEGGKADAET